MLFLALSCLQGPAWHQERAAETLLGLGRVDGLQLTPGNPGGWSREPWFRWNRHMGHGWDRPIERVYGPGDEPKWRHGSIHARANWRTLAERGDGLVLECMYPGAKEPAGFITTEDYAWAVQNSVPVALDLSHASIAIARGVLTEEAVMDLLARGDVREVHLSYNDGRADQHRPVPAAYPWLGAAEAWAKAHPDRPVVLECYMHRLSDDQRRDQVARLEGCAA